MKLTYERAKALFAYDFATGALVWKARPQSDFPTFRAMRVWNARYAGKPAGTVSKRDGRLTITVDDAHYAGGRVAFLLANGRWPSKQVDHENHNPLDNSGDNLRDVSDLGNKRNLPMFKTNTSGHVGVTWDVKAGKWRAQVSVNNKCRYLGIFENIADAVEARRVAQMELGFHPNHGSAEKS